MTRRLAALLVAILATLALAGCGSIYSDSECHDAYVHDYVDYGTQYDMGEEAYCKNLNDTSYLDTP
jgi:uncharacterized protein YceK